MERIPQCSDYSLDKRATENRGPYLICLRFCFPGMSILHNLWNLVPQTGELCVGRYAPILDTRWADACR